MNQGIDCFFGYNCQRKAHNYYPAYLWSNDTKVMLPENAGGKSVTYSPDLIQKKILEFIEQHKGRPFFLFMPITLPHAELIVPEDSIIQEFRGRYSETPYKGVDAKTAFEKGGYRSQEHPRATHAAMVTRIDLYVGEVVEKLRETGVFENTLIVFTSDNGPHREGGADPGFFNSNGIYRGYKRDLYEGAIRVPTIISWQGRVPSGSESDFPFAFWDYLPTFAGLTGQDAPAATDGIDILPALFGQEGQAERDYFYFEFHELGGRQALIKGNWKLLRLDIRQEERYELYNIASDPSENHNLLKRYPDKATELREIMEEARIDDPDWPLF